MKKVAAMAKKIAYSGKDHGSFEHEWQLHKNCSEWWYATGTLDSGGSLYSFQFTLIRARAAFLRPYILMLALTDFQTQKHHYYQNFDFIGKSVTAGETSVSFGSTAKAEKTDKGIRLTADGGTFGYDILLDYGKGAVWNCDNGYLKMGVDKPGQSTFYYSYTNMPVTGSITVEGQKSEVTGKGWFDKQGGPYKLIKPETHWEWFSLRFFDEEEAMLFSFPQDDYRDGTYIDKAGNARRLNNYTIEPLEFVKPDGKTTYSCKWEITLPGFKDEKYFVTPMMKGQMNIGYYELLADICDTQGVKKGICFVELLPGARNSSFTNLLFSKTEK